MKKISVLLLIFTMLFTSLSFGEGYKEESIYGLISESGSVEKIYVVNALNNLTFDYGSYDGIENLTSLANIEKSETRIILPEFEKTFYYQGMIENPSLPWTFDFDYTLDQKQVDFNDLAGGSGDLKIKIKVTPGSEDLIEFYNNYALQIGLSFSNDLTKNLKAEGATLVEAGGNKQVTFTMLPGQGGSVEVSASIEDFEMDAITINGVKMVFDMDIDTESLTEELAILTEAAEGLDQGATEILKGLNQVSKGLTDYSQGMKAYKDGIYNLSASSLELTAGLQEIAGGLEALKNQEESLRGGLSSLKAQTFSQIDEKLKAMGLEMPPLNEENYEAILGQDESFIPIIIEIEQSLGFINGMNAYIQTVGLLSNGTKEISQGFQEYSQGVSALAVNAQKLYENSKALNNALIELKKGMETYQAGTESFKNETKNIDQVLEKKVNEMLGSFSGDAYETQSFVSKENEAVLSVQFFFRNDEIKKDVVKAVIEEEKPTTLWQRIKSLFSFLD